MPEQQDVDMHGTDAAEHPDDDAGIEIVDLDDAGSDLTKREPKKVAQVKQAVVTWQHALTKKRVRGTSAIMFVVLVVLILALNFHTSLVARLLPAASSPVEKLPPPLKIMPSLLIAQQKDGYVCTDGGAWSPDSRFIAIVGYTQCSNTDIQLYSGTVIHIYDAASGKSVAALHPDQKVLSALQAEFPQQRETPSLEHRSLLWSPDGTHIALTLGITYKNGNIYTYATGVWLSDIGGKDAHVLLDKHIQSSANYLFLYTEWDVQHNQVTDSHVINGASYGDSASIPTAAAYQWGTHGDLLPQGDYTTATPPRQATPGAVGNPVGGKSFTVWQSASVELTKQGPSADSMISGPGVYLWSSYFCAWSPDGRYLIDAVIITARMEPVGLPKPTQRDLATLQMNDLPLMPVRDIALRAVLLSFAGKSDSRQDFAFVSWSPGGRALAVQPSSWPRFGRSVDVYQSSTGYRRAVLSMPFLPAPTSGQNGFFQVGFSWSPDGSMILAQDPITGVWAIWHVPALLR